MFSFGVLTYNQEEFIIEHLESIKYQVETFAGGEPIQLVLADDGSSDRTLYLAKKWIDINKDLFYRVDFVSDGDNHGTCENVARMYEHIYGDRFMTLAGDDLYGYASIFEYISFLSQYDILDSQTLAFNDSDYQIRTGYYDEYRGKLHRALYKNHMMRYLSICQCPAEGPGTAMKKQLLTDAMLKKMREFDLVDDQPRLYYLYKYNKLKRKYIEKAYILYRVHEKSISHSDSKSEIGLRRQADMEQLCKYYMENEKNLFYKIAAWNRLQRVRGNKLFLTIDPATYLLKFCRALHWNKMQHLYKEIVVDALKDNQSYLNEIHDMAIAAQRSII